MIAYLNGKLAYKSPALVHIDVNGIGYEVQISRGWFGSYNMRVNGPNERASYKVTRLK